MNSLTVLPAATGRRQLERPCAKLIRAAEIECSAFVFATEQLFGKDVALRAGGLWVNALGGRFWVSMSGVPSAVGDDPRGRYLLQGDVAKARVAYQDFLTLWEGRRSRYPRPATGQSGVREVAVAKDFASTSLTQILAWRLQANALIEERYRSLFPVPGVAGNSETKLSSANPALA